MTASRRRLAGLASSLDSAEGQSGGRENRSTDFLLGLCLLAPLSAMGELLIRATHHRPLGAATFASVALVSWVVFGLFVRTSVPADGTERIGRARMSLWVFGLVSSAAVFLRALLN